MAFLWTSVPLYVLFSKFGSCLHKSIVKGFEAKEPGWGLKGLPGGLEGLTVESKGLTGGMKTSVGLVGKRAWLGGLKPSWGPGGPG